MSESQDTKKIKYHIVINNVKTVEELPDSWTNEDLIKLLDKVNHQPTHYCVLAERNVLKILEGDCETAVGAIAKIDKGNINLEAELFSLDGKERFYHKASKELKLASELGKEVGLILKKESNNSYKK